MPEVLVEIGVIIVFNLELRAHFPEPSLLVEGREATRVVKDFSILVFHSFIKSGEVLFLGLMPSQLGLLKVPI